MNTQKNTHEHARMHASANTQSCAHQSSSCLLFNTMMKSGVVPKTAFSHKIAC